MSESEKILSAIYSLKDSINDNSKKIDEMKNLVSETNSKLHVMEKELEFVKRENEQLKLINQQQNVKITLLEMEVRCKNLILYGFNFQSESRLERLQELANFITEKLVI